MNPAAILALIGDLYMQIQSLQTEVEKLKAEKAERDMSDIGRDE